MPAFLKQHLKFNIIAVFALRQIGHHPDVLVNPLNCFILINIFSIWGAGEFFRIRDYSEDGCFAPRSSPYYSDGIEKVPCAP